MDAEPEFDAELDCAESDEDSPDDVNIVLVTEEDVGKLDDPLREPLEPKELEKLEAVALGDALDADEMLLEDEMADDETMADDEMADDEIIAEDERTTEELEQSVQALRVGAKTTTASRPFELSS
jgi:hypothetical protein